MTLCPVAVYRLMLGVIAAAFVVGVLAPVVYHGTGHGGLRYLMLRFDPGQEANLPTWLASVLLLAAGATVLAIAELRRRAGQRAFLVHWYVLAGLVLLAAIDETAGFHELLTPAMKQIVATSGAFDNAWMFPVAAGLVVAAGFYLPWLAALPGRTARRVVLAGVIFIGGAMVCEGLGSLVLDHVGAGGWSYALIVATEEAMENLGTATFIYAMLGLLGETQARMVIRVADRGQADR